MLMLK
ncbi:hypothetical protein TIFTF001_050890 [Ficus carica]